MPDGGNGEYRVLLEAAVQCVGVERLERDGSQRTAYESGAGSEDGCVGFGMDSGFRNYSKLTCETDVYMIY